MNLKKLGLIVALVLADAALVIGVRGAFSTNPAAKPASTYDQGFTAAENQRLALYGIHGVVPLDRAGYAWCDHVAFAKGYSAQWIHGCAVGYYLTEP